MIVMMGAMRAPAHEALRASAARREVRFLVFQFECVCVCVCVCDWLVDGVVVMAERVAARGREAESSVFIGVACSEYVKLGIV